MAQDKRFLVDVGIDNLLYPINAISRVDAYGQPSIASISIQTKILQKFEAQWIDKFMQTLHNHKGCIGTQTLSKNIMDYLKDLDASHVKVVFEYPFFVEKVAPISREENFVSYRCAYSVEAHSLSEVPKTKFRIHIPVITTYPASSVEVPLGLFGQLSVVDITIESQVTVYPEDIIELVDSLALAPVYSYLSQEDQKHLIQTIHSKERFSVTMVDEIKNELARKPEITSASIRCVNRGMLHSFTTMVSTEKSRGVPGSGFSDDY